jgi:phosphoribosylamine--glycine ligase
MLPGCRNVNIRANEIEKLGEFVLEKKIGLVVVGPEDPLVNAIADFFEVMDVSVFGPKQKGAMLEGSKSFTKKILKKYHIPTAGYRVFNRASAAEEYVMKHKLTKVIKADGLTGGKGVSVYKTVEEGLEAIDNMMRDGIYGEAGSTVVIEDRLRGLETSYQFFTDGSGAILELETVEDHKALLDKDRGPNTGGMGTLSPSRIVTRDIREKMRGIAKRLVYALKKEGIDYRGLIYVGFMIVDGEPYVLEINCRFGDPETQPLMLKMKSDIVPILLDCANGNLKRKMIRWDRRSAACIVLASKGYPENPEKGKEISGLNNVGSIRSDLIVFHAGTVAKGDRVLTNGGRVLGVTALGYSPEDAAKRAYAAASLIKFEGKQWRKDIPRKLEA